MSSACFSKLPPEVISLIASYLNHHDLAQCLRLSHSHTTIFTPLFWRVLRANIRFCNETSLKAFLHNKRHVRHLVLTDPHVAQILALKLQGEGTLQSLSVRFPREAASIFSIIEPRPEAWDLAATRRENAVNFGNTRVVELFLVRNWNLRELVLDESCFRNRDGSDAFCMVMAVCPIARLEKLEIRFGRSFYRSTAAVASTSPPPYRMDDLLTLLWSAMEAIDTFGWFKNLKELVVSGGNHHIDFSRLAFLVRCLRVERIRLENLDKVAIVSLATALRHCCSLLTHLEWRGPCTGEDMEIAGLLGASQSGWKEVSLPDMETFGPLSMEALMKSVSTTLEVLKVGGWGNERDVEFLEILYSARNLRWLEGSADEMVLEETQQFTLWGYFAFENYRRDMDRTWGLGPSMEYLQLRIEEVPRPDVVCRRNGDPVTIPRDLLDNKDSDTQRYNVQRWIYTQLGRLTGLQELILGVRKPDPKVWKKAGLKKDVDLGSIASEERLKDVYPMFIYHSLEFSLKSGLKLLEGLKKLKVLDVWGTAHRIGIKELEWMRKNWPRLREVRGLVSRREWAGNVEAGLASEDAVVTWLARHKNGIGSYYPETL